MNSSYLFRFMYHLFGGFTASASFCVLTAAFVWWREPSQFQGYVAAYVALFNCLVTAGLIIAAATFVADTKKSIPSLIERAFDADALSETTYARQKRGYLSLTGTIVFSSCYIIAAFFIFYFCRFPLHGAAEAFLIAIACIEYGLGVYVGRKLYFIANMMDAITNIRIVKSIYRSGEINSIISYVNILSTITIVFVYVHVKSFYSAPFAFDGPIGPTLRLVLLLPALIAVPILVIFNFYPRIVIRKIFLRDIQLETDNLMRQLTDQQIAEIDRLSYIVEYDRLARDEVRGMLQLSLSDLPMGVTILFMIIGAIMKI